MKMQLTKEQEQQLAEYEILKEEKKEQLENVTTNITGKPLNGDNFAQLNMSSVISIASWKFAKTLNDALENLALDPNASEDLKAVANAVNTVYTSVYEQIITWRGADNQLYNIKGEEIAISLLDTMQKKGNILIGQNSV